MARNFPATNSRINWTVTPAIGAASSATLFAGWFLPTTLTAGRGFWSAGNIIGLEVGGTTSEVVGRIQSATNGVYTSSGAGIAINNWYFIAHYIDATNTGPNSNQFLWIGTIESPPVEQTFTQTTAPVGAFSSQTAMVVGNKGAAGTTAFQGEVGNCFLATQSTNTRGPFNLSAFGPTGKDANQLATEKAGLLNNFIIPWWRGEPLPTRGRDFAFSGATANLFTMYAALLDYDGATTQTPGVSFQSGVGTNQFLPNLAGVVSVSRLRSPALLQPESQAPHFLRL